MQIAMLTSLKPFEREEIAMLQRRAILNWRPVLGRNASIVAVQGESLVLPDELLEQNIVVRKGSSFNQALDIMKTSSDAEAVVYCNGDILLPADIVSLFKFLPDGDCLVVGQRVDQLQDGRFHTHVPAGMDYFIFKRGMFADLPLLRMGRGGCDSALVAYCLRRDIPVIDASFAFPVVHQWHDYGHIQGGFEEAHYGKDAQTNRQLHGLRDFAPHCIDATVMLSRDGRLMPNFRRSMLRCLEVEFYYRRGYQWFPNLNRVWNILTRGGQWCRNPQWNVQVVDGIHVDVRQMS